MKRILLAILSVLAVLTCPTALVAAQEAVLDDPAQAAYLDRASQASLSLDDVGPGWQADGHYTLFIEALGLVVSDAMFSSPDEHRINLFNTVFVGDPTPVDRAYALQWPDFTRRGARIADGPPVGTEWVWIGPMLDPTQPTPTPPTGQPFLSVDFGVMFKAPGGVGTVVLRGEPGRFSQADVVPLALIVAERLGWAPDR